MVSGILIGKLLRGAEWAVAATALYSFGKLFSKRPALATAVITDLRFHPVKSMAGQSAEEVELDALGVVGDRRFMVAKASDGVFISARSHPKMVLLKPVLGEDGSLSITRPDGKVLKVTVPAEGGDLREVSVWGNSTPAVDCGDDAAAWLSAYLETDVRLVTVAYRANQRRVPPKYNQGSTTQAVGFPDGFPFLLISEASLADLNSRLDEPVSMQNFRPNIVVSGCDAFGEDRWKEIRINGVVFYCGKSCTRCVLTTVNPKTGVKGKEPLRTLQKFRRGEGKKFPLFGVNMTHGGCSGQIHVGDTIEVLSWWGQGEMPGED